MESGGEKERKSSFFGRRKTSSAFTKNARRLSMHNNATIHSGYLQKKGSGLAKQWSSRYFELSGHYLRYFEKKEQTDTVKGVIDLRDLRGVSSSESEISIGMDNGQKVLLKGTSSEVAETWVKEIQETALKADEGGQALYEHYKEEEDGERFFFEECLLKLCTEKKLIGPKLSEKDVGTIFAQVKVGRRASISFERFHEAMRKISDKLERSYQELISELCEGDGGIEKIKKSQESMAGAKKVNDYEQIGKTALGTGGQGSTYHVRHKKSGREYAAKLITCNDMEETSAAHKEAQAMAVMSGPQFVEYVDSYSVQVNLQYQLWILMEYCEKGDLQQLINTSPEKRLPEDQIARILTPVLNGLRQMHAKNYMHRDVKPANILIDSKGSFGKVADFGLAKHSESALKTATNTGIGTFRYMAPETIAAVEGGNARYSATADVFSFGIVLAEACGSTIDKSAGTQKDVDQIIENIPRAPKSAGVEEKKEEEGAGAIVGGYSEALIDVVRAALRIKTDDVPRKSAHELLKMPFFEPHFQKLDEIPDMLKDEIKLAGNGPWAFLINVSGQQFEERSNKVRISRSSGMDSAVVENLRAELVAKIAALPENKNFKEDYEIKEIVVADVLRRAIALVSTGYDLSTKYEGLGLFGSKEKDGYQPFAMSWATEEKHEQRQAVWDRFEQFKTMAQEQFPNVRVLLAFHLAPDAKVSEGILEGNFADLSQNDAGYFGKAVYLTTSVEYATHFYGTLYNRKTLHLIVCAVVIGNSYPVIECPFTAGGEKNEDGLLGSTIAPKADSHIVIVGSDPVANQHLGDHSDDPLPVPPEKWDHCRTYTEIAVKSESQILPLGYIELEMKEKKKAEMEDAPAESMGKLGEFSRERGNAEQYFDKAVELSSKRKKHHHLRRRAKLYSDTGRIEKAIADLEEAVRLEPKWVEGLVELAKAYEGAKRWTQALETYKRIVKADPSKMGEYFDKMTDMAEQLSNDVRLMEKHFMKGTMGEACTVKAARAMEAVEQEKELLSKAQERAGKAMVSTVAGVVGSAGHADGEGKAAKFNRPCAVSFASDGSMWVGDSSNYCIRRVSADGTVDTVAGAAESGHADGKGTEAKFKYPHSIACAADGSMWVGDYSNHCIRRVSADGTVSTVAGEVGSAGHADGKGAAAKFNAPHSIACAADGSMWVGDHGNHCIRRISADGTVSTVAGVAESAGHADGEGTEAKFNGPIGVSFAADGSAWVADYRNHCIRRISADGTVSTVAGVVGSAGHADGKGTGAKFNNPLGVACTADGSVWVTDYRNHCIRRIDEGGIVSTVGSVGSAGHADGKGSEAKFNHPQHLACAPDGSIWVGDYKNQCIRRVQTEPEEQARRAWTPASTVEEWSHTVSLGSTEWAPIKKSTLVGTISTGIDYEVSFDLKLKGAIAEYGSIVHFTATGADGDKYGCRIPGIWTNPNNPTLHVASSHEADKNYVSNTRTLALNKEVRVRVRVQGTARTVWFDDEKVLDEPTKMGARQAHEGVQVYVGDPWYEPANAELRNLRYTNLLAEEKPATTIEVVSSSGTPWENAGITFDAAKVLDGDASTRWNPQGPARHFNKWEIVFDIHTVVTMKAVSIRQFGDTTHDIKVFELGTSDTKTGPWVKAGDSFTVPQSAIGNTGLHEIEGVYGTQCGRFWRFLITATPDGWQPSPREIIFKMEEKPATTIEVVSSSGTPWENAGITFDAAKVLDGDASTRWNPQGPARHFNKWEIVFDIHTVVTMKAVSIRQFGDTTHDIKVFELGTSDTKTGPWVKAGDSFTVPQSAIGNTGLHEIEGVYGTQCGRFWRFLITATPDGWQPSPREIIFKMILFGTITASTSDSTSTWQSHHYKWPTGWGKSPDGLNIEGEGIVGHSYKALTITTEYASAQSVCGIQTDSNQPFYIEHSNDGKSWLRVDGEFTGEDLHAEQPLGPFTCRFTRMTWETTSGSDGFHAQFTGVSVESKLV